MHATCALLETRPACVPARASLDAGDNPQSSLPPTPIAMRRVTLIPSCVSEGPPNGGVMRRNVGESRPGRVTDASTCSSGRQPVSHGVGANPELVSWADHAEHASAHPQLCVINLGGCLDGERLGSLHDLALDR